MNDEPDDVGRHEPQLSDDLQSFAADLTRLRPRDDRLNRERLAFLAGQASVAHVSNRPARILGLPLESRAWPAAFASMTAVAAALLLALVIRPETSAVPPSFENGPVPRDALPLAIESRDVRGVLTTRDAYLPDVETRLASREPSRADAEISPAPSIDRVTPVLTPNAWHQVIDEIEPARPSPHDATGVSQNRGVNS